jgi:hypothetical protein
VAADIAVVKDKVQTYLRELAGSFEVDSEDVYTFQLGSTSVFVKVNRMDEHVVVLMWCILTRGTPPSPELYEYVATESANYAAGTLSARKREDGSVVVTLVHQLLGDFLDPEELKLAVSLMAATADGLDDEIVKRFGGQVVHAD